MRNHWSMGLAALGILWMLSSCGPSPTEGTEERIDEYDEDGVLGFTNTNPNLQTSPTYHTYAYDQGLVRKTLSEYPDIRNPQIVFDGATLRLDYELAGAYSAVEAEYLETELRDKLRAMLPRYDIVIAGPDQYE